VLVSNAGSPFVNVDLVQTTTLTAGAINFEVTYDDTNWITIPNAQVVDPSTLAQISLPYTLQASTNKNFLVAMAGARQLRIKTSTGITGTGNVTPFVTELNYNLFAQLNTSGAQKVDGSGVTQPVSGTVTTTPPANASTNIAQINAVTPLMGNGVTGTGSQRVTIASDNTAFGVNATLAAETTKVIGTVRSLGNAGATLDSAPAATAPTNTLQVGGTFTTTPTTLTTGQAGSLQLTAAQTLKTDQTTIAGTALDVNSGNKSAGTQRVVLATDQPALTNKLLVTPDSVALPANQSVNVSQINAVTPLMGNGVTGTGSQRVTIASDNTAFNVTNTPAAATTVKSTALEASHVLKASAGGLVSVGIYNTKASAQFILIMDSSTVPADGAVTLLYPPINIPAAGNAHLNFTTPLSAANGIAICNSSTGTFTKTVGSADCVFTAEVQ